MENPLLSSSHLPPFSQIKAEHVVPAVEYIIKQATHEVKQLELLADTATWQNFAAVLEDVEMSIDNVWSSVSHLNSVTDSDELREAYQQGKEVLTNFHTQLAQNLTLFTGYKRIAESNNFDNLSAAQKRIVSNSIRDFTLSGAELPEKEKKRFAEIVQELSKLQVQFEQNLLDATQAWHLLITDESELAGLPEYALEMSKANAERNEQTGWRFGLDFPSYLAIMQYADSSEVREKIYRAFVTRASNQSDNPNEFDNAPVIDNILKLRHEKALLLGFSDYTELALATKMADDADEVTRFLQDIAIHAKPIAVKEIAELNEFAKTTYGREKLDPWDYSYFSEKLKQEKFSLDSEVVKQYLPAEKVISGMFDVCQRLFGVTVKQNTTTDTWHQDVLTFDIFNGKNKLVGQFFSDLYAREGKRSGAWMGVCRHRQNTSSNHALPVAFLTCNFTPAAKGKPALLTHDEVETLFHEFGHTLHHLLTQVDEMGVAGINGVAWDAVELPSQFLENWCWHAESLPLISAHYKTNEPLPNSLLKQMLAAKHFQTGMQTVRQLEFSLFDISLHKQDNQSDKSPSVQDVLNTARNDVSVIQAPEYNRFQCSFSHIFAGGYAAGYYSYKWAEVLSADAFDEFEQNGIFDKITGAKFLASILSAGGVPTAASMFKDFKGRAPSIDALLKSTGLA